MARNDKYQSVVKEIAGECVAVRVRALNRAVTAIYDEALRPYGARVGQMNILAVVARMNAARPSDICRLLRMDKSTLSRDLEIMRRNGWLELGDGDSGRSRPWVASTAGLALLEATLPAWRQAQARTKELLGEEDFATLTRIGDRLWAKQVGKA